MSSTTFKRVVLCIVITTICCVTYFQLSIHTITASDGPNAQEIVAAAEAIRNAAVEKPHKFGIQPSDVHTLRVTDSVPSSKAGVRHLYLAQEVGGLPIANTLLSAVVKLELPSDESSIESRSYISRLADSFSTAPMATVVSNAKKNVVETVALQRGQALVRNADNCINTKTPKISNDDALSLALFEIFGVRNTKFRRRTLKADDARSSNKNVRQQSIFEHLDGISMNDTQCQLSYWSTYNNTVAEDDSDCNNVRLSWECIIRPNRTDYMQIFVDATDGTVINLSEFGPSSETDVSNDPSYATQQQEVPWRRRLSAFSAVQYPNENPCPNCPRFGESMARSDKTFDASNIEPLSLVRNPEFIDSSPNGWLKIGDTTYDETRGNNVKAASLVEQDSIDPYESGVTTSATDSSSNVFDYSHQSIVHRADDIGLDDHVSASLEAAVVNAFYWANIVHDIYYQYGFNEESGNFQEDNFGKGGKGGDSVIVEVRESSQFNNAFFANGKDGKNPLLLLYLFIKSDETMLKVEGEEYRAKPFAFGPTEFNLLDVPIMNSKGRVCQSIRDNVYEGSIVVIDRGSCSFSSKVKNAQDRGATAVILVVDHWDRAAFSLSDADDSIRVPSVSITTKDAKRLLATIKSTSKSALGPGLIVRDGAFDSSIIVHEYCHGITARLTGGPSTTMCLNQDVNRELGKEGWEDMCSLFVTASKTTGRTRTIGSFASWSLFGIRPFPYSTDMDINPTTYGRLNRNPNYHFTGTIFGSMLWELYWAMIDYEEENGRLGFNENKYDSQRGGSNIAMQLIIEGLKIQPCSPSFVQSRDAILLADRTLYDGRYKCVIWHSFAKRGLGKSAVASPFGTTLDVTEAFDVPSYCTGPMLTLASHNYTILTGDGDSFIDSCESLTIAITVENTGHGNLTDLQLVGLSSNIGSTALINQLPMRFLDLSETDQMSFEVDLVVDGVSHDQPLELEAKFMATELVQPLPIVLTFTETSSNVVAKEKVSWNFDEPVNSIDGYFSLEPSRSTLMVGDVAYYSPVAKFGPQMFSIKNALIQQGQGLGCEEVGEGVYADFVVIFERGGCEFSFKVKNAQNGGALAVIISNNNLEEHPFNMNGDASGISIPSVMVGKADGLRIKQQIYKDLATLSFNAEHKESLSSHLPLPKQCNRVRFSSFVLNDNTIISMWVNFGIDGIDRANIGLFSKGKRVTIVPDGGHLYNSYGAVKSDNIEGCPAPGITGWRKGTGPVFQEVIFSSDALRETNMMGETVQLDIAFATGEDTIGSYFAIQRVELMNVGMVIPEKESGLCPGNTSPSDPSGAQEGINDEEVEHIEGSKESGKEFGGGVVFTIFLVLLVVVASLVYLSRRRKRKEKKQVEISFEVDLENPTRPSDAVQVSPDLSDGLVTLSEEKKGNGSVIKVKGSQPDLTAIDNERRISDLTESSSSSFTFSTESDSAKATQYADE